MSTSFLRQMRDGIVTNNPVFVQFLGMCSVLAVTTSVTNASGMGLSVTAVLICSNLFISLLRKAIPKQVRIAAYIIVISGFVTAVELIIKAYLPALDKSLGLFIPLIVVNCIILARAEAFASKNKPLPSVIDGLASGIGPNMGIVTITIDDNAPITVDDYRGNTNPKDRTIAENLKPGKHTVTFEITGKNEKSGGYEFEIGAILVG